MISFTVPGRAQPGGSKRAFVRGGHAVISDANPNVHAWRERVALAAAQAARAAKLLDCPLELDVAVEFQRPAGHRNSRGELNKKGRETPYPASKPDTTKLVRAIEDALNGVVWTDDSRVVKQTASKSWGERDQVRISIAPMRGDSQ